MKVNYHFHSRVSFDAEYPLAEMCRAAREAGQRHLCVTDHCDLIDEYGKPDDSFDWSRVDEELRQARAMFPDLEIRRGVELGQALLRPESAERVLREPGIDFVLGSMHNTPAGLDYYWTKFTDRRQCLEILEQYLNYLLQLSGTDFFDSLAHLTYPIRYMRFRDGVEVDFHPFDDLILEILRTLAERGKALEVNASGYRQGLGEPLPPAYILRMYREAGGELVTIGTDAHEPGHMADGLDRAAALIGACGFRYITLYEKRNPKPIKLEDVL